MVKVRCLKLVLKLKIKEKKLMAFRNLKTQSSASSLFVKQSFGFRGIIEYYLDADGIFTM